MTSFSSLMAISPVDGRYRSKTEQLAPYFSEFGLIRYRIQVEVEYLIALSDFDIITPFTESQKKGLRAIYEDFNESDARAVKDIEKTTNHDVKAVEYFIKTQLPELELDAIREFVHFALTSQDINNTAIPLSLKLAANDVLFPKLKEIIERLEALSQQWKHIPMLAKTHGQPASPTNLGKEVKVFVERLTEQYRQLSAVSFNAKFGGATGNLNAHHVAFPDKDWVKFGNEFVASLGLKRSQFTTQIEHYDNLASFFDALKRINTILTDLDRDMWQYISSGYFTQKVKAGEVGSSAMPHKVNPIDFENSEGNLGVANALLEHLSAKLPISRLQRDLTDSTVLRNIGVPLAHSVLAYDSLLKGLGKVKVNEATISADLDDNWAVVAEAIQNILRREGYPNPYEALKALTRTGKPIDRALIAEFIEELDVAEDVKAELKAISPHNYTGIVDF